MRSAEHLEANLASASFRWRGQEVRIEARKPLAMLCFLCLNDGGSSRERLAELLWGPERLLNVRQAIYQLRQLPGADHWLHVGELVRVEAKCDVRRFEAAVEAGDFELAPATWSPPLLHVMEVPRADDFREWLEARYRLREMESTELSDTFSAWSCYGRSTSSSTSLPGSPGSIRANGHSTPGPEDGSNEPHRDRRTAS